MAPHLELFRFRYRDPRTGKWVRARYAAEVHDIAARHDKWELMGAAEIREVDLGEQRFNPWRTSTPAEPVTDTPPAEHPRLDTVERYLVRLFLRRHVTWCARRGRYAEMEGAARLFAELRRPGTGAPLS